MRSMLAAAAAAALSLSLVAGPGWSQQTLSGMPTPSVGTGFRFTLPPGWSFGAKPGITNDYYFIPPVGTKVRCMATLGANNYPSEATQADLDYTLRSAGPHRPFDVYANGQPITRYEERVVERNGKVVLRGEMWVETPAGRFLFHGLYTTNLKFFYGIACGGLETDWPPAAEDVERIVSTFEVVE